MKERVLFVSAWLLIGFDAVGHWYKLTGLGIDTGYGVVHTFEYNLFWSLFWFLVLALYTTALYIYVTKEEPCK